MERFYIEGGRALRGEIPIQGAKNSVLPILAATILRPGLSVLHNCPRLRDVEASMQVAHAISTNKLNMESDYFTAMDDLLSGATLEEAGSAMIGDTDYNSACYYSYASLDTDILMENLKDTPDAAQIVKAAVPALVRTMALTNPSGKQNSFAGNVLPSAILIECKEEKVPVSMVNAFVRPIKPEAANDYDLVKGSIQALPIRWTPLIPAFA